MRGLRRVASPLLHCEVTAQEGADAGERGIRVVEDLGESLVGAMLLEAGLAEITFEKVADRAGASKMTLYKWWSSPGSLAFEAYFTAVEDTSRSPTPATSSATSPPSSTPSSACSPNHPPDP
jgi:hypothetical protein